MSAYRESLRTHSGREIGRWPDYPAMRRETEQSTYITRLMGQVQDLREAGS